MPARTESLTKVWTFLVGSCIHFCKVFVYRIYPCWGFNQGFQSINDRAEQVTIGVMFFIMEQVERTLDLKYTGKQIPLDPNRQVTCHGAQSRGL